MNRAGTSFLTATPITAGQPVRVDASIGDHLYWSFPATAGQVHEITATVTFPKGRSGASTWTVDVFDGLRRRQACTAGAQTPTVDAKASNVVLGCTLREVRSWAEPWSADPLPGTYVVRLSVIDLPEPDLGAPIDVDLLVGTIADRGASADDGELAAPLVPNTKAGTVLNGVPPVDAEADDESGSLGGLVAGSRLALGLDRHRWRARRGGRRVRLRGDPTASTSLNATSGGPALRRGHQRLSYAGSRAATSR